jgi:hypothetical protein
MNSLGFVKIEKQFADFFECSENYFWRYCSPAPGLKSCEIVKTTVRSQNECFFTTFLQEREFSTWYSDFLFKCPKLRVSQS